MATELSRRTFLVGTSAAAIAVALPSLPVGATIGVDLATKPSQMAFAVGTPGEFDWRAIRASSPEEAFREWAWDHWGDDEDQPEFDPEYVNRVERWDGTPDVKPGDWLRAGLGHCCSRCGYETCQDEGALAVGDEAVCAECLTLAEKATDDPEYVAEELADRISCDGEEEVRAWLDEKGWWAALPPAVWQRARALSEEG